MQNETLRFAQLARRAATLGALRKLTLSMPSGKAQYKKVTLSLYVDKSDCLMVSSEMLMSDGKMIRKNYTTDSVTQLLCELLPKYSRANLLTPSAEAQLMTSKKGKTTLIGEANVNRALDSGELAEAKSGNNDKKHYIFDGGEKWLCALGISNSDGRIHDKKQSKFRQINRFTELLDDVYDKLPSTGTLNVCDLCCGKSYLSFAVYEYLTSHKKREVNMLGVDRKRDVIDYCNDTARKIGADGLRFVAADIGEDKVYTDAFGDGDIHLTVSLHACDIATDIVLRRAVLMKSRIILSTPCCHHELYGKLKSQPLSFITDHSMLAQKLNDAVTDGLRVKMLEVEGYHVDTVELVDPEETPKNVLIRAIKRKNSKSREKLTEEYSQIIEFLGLSGSYYDIYK